MIISEVQLRKLIRSTIKESLNEIEDMNALKGAAAHGKMSMGDRDYSLDDFQKEEPIVSELPSEIVPESELLARLKEKAEEYRGEVIKIKNEEHSIEDLLLNIELTSRIFSDEFPAELLDIIYMDIVNVACKHSTCTEDECIDKVYHNTRHPKYAPANTPESMIDSQGYYPTLRELLARCL